MDEHRAMHQDIRPIGKIGRLVESDALEGDTEPVPFKITVKYIAGKMWFAC